MSEVESQEVEGQEGEPSSDAQPPEHSSGEEAADMMQEEAEAEEAEVEQEPEPEPEAQALSQKDMEDRWKRIGKSAAVWRKRLPEVFEGDVEMFAPCPLCEPLTPGYVMLTPDTQERFPAVREFMGDAQPAEYQ